MIMTKEEILAFLREHKPEMEERFGVIRIGLFGSYVRGEAREDSDIDFSIELTSNSADTYFGLLHYLEDSFQKRIDLGLESSFKPLIKPYIMKEIIYV
ncbi:MAG: nucleotidyltransferase family protein [Geobacteraceae bacterium]|nr:nucleotidyltransferase family protein [Geobacteraceae bacterium]